MAYNSPKALLKGIKADFSKILETTPKNEFEKFITRVKSNSNEEKYWVLESLPGFKEWTDKRHFGDFGDKYMTVKNYDWDAGLEVERDTINDSRQYLGGNVEAWVKGLVKKYNSFPAKLCQALLDANSNAFDGTAFFATTRSGYTDTGSNTINNLLTGTSSTTYSLSEFQTDFQAAQLKLLGFKDKDDEPFNEDAKLIVYVPSHMKDIANQLLNARSEMIYISSQQSNIYAGGAEIVINYRQGSSDNDWYLINANSPYNMFLIQDREGTKWDFKDDWENKFIKYGVDFRMGYSFLNPFCVVKTNN